jgi:hypothetical protein
MKTDNTLPSGIHDLFRLGEQMGDGLALHGPFLKMTQTPAEEFRGLLERLRNAETLLSEARVAKAGAGAESTAADAALLKWLVNAKRILLIVLGRKWSERWLQAGFTHRRTNIPKRMEARIALARGVTAFLSSYREFELVAIQLTGDDGRGGLERMLTAQKELRAAKVACGARKRTRDRLERALRLKMRQVVVILGVSIAANSDRWLAFGLNRPMRAAGGRRPVVAGTAPSELISLPQAASGAELALTASAA